MKLHVLAVGLLGAALLGEPATAQTIRAPTGQTQIQNPNLNAAPASADLAALQQRAAQLEAAHNRTLRLLAETQAALKEYAICEAALMHGALQNAYAVPLGGCPNGQNIVQVNLANTQRLAIKLDQAEAQGID